MSFGVTVRRAEVNLAAHLPSEPLSRPARATDIDASFLRITSCEVSANGTILRFFSGSDLVYSTPKSVSAGSYGSVTKYAAAREGFPQVVCIKTFADPREFENERKVTAFLNACRDLEGSTRIRAVALEMPNVLSRATPIVPLVTETGRRRILKPTDFVYALEKTSGTSQIVMMEFASGSLAELTQKLSFADAMAVTRAVLLEVAYVNRAAGLITVDVKPENFLYQKTAEGDVRVMAADYGAYCLENSESTQRSYVHPSLGDHEPVLANRANCIFACGVTLLRLCAGQPRLMASDVLDWLYVGESRAPEYEAMLRDLQGPAPFVDAVYSLVRFDQTAGFGRTQGADAEKGDFVRAANILSHALNELWQVERS